MFVEDGEVGLLHGPQPDLPGRGELRSVGQAVLLMAMSKYLSASDAPAPGVDTVGGRCERLQSVFGTSCTKKTERDHGRVHRDLDPRARCHERRLRGARGLRSPPLL